MSGVAAGVSVTVSRSTGDFVLPSDTNSDGRLDISDAVRVLGFLFLGGLPPVLGAGCVEIPGCPQACRAES